MDELAAAVKAEIPEEFDSLAAENRAELAEAVTAAAKERSRLIGKAIDDSLRYLPGLLRGPVKRVLGV